MVLLSSTVCNDSGILAPHPKWTEPSDITKKNAEGGSRTTTAKSRTGKKNIMIQNAKENQRAWSEFKKLDLSCGSESNTASKVSFQIKSAKGGKKKMKKKKIVVDPNQVDNRESPRATEDHGAPNNFETANSSSPACSIMDDSLCYQCPRWTLVIDTCSLLHDNGMHMQNIIDMANRSSCRARTDQHGTLPPPSTVAAVEEPIDIVIPHKVWSELEYQSKSTESNNAYAARMAIRMLRDELESRSSSIVGGGIIHNNANAIGGVVRSQSLLESRDAADRFLSRDSKSTNDDSILGCAMMENEIVKDERCGSEKAAPAAGGVVLVTLDNNLACKGYANGLNVFSPMKFVEYYNKRMCSLRQRATVSLVDSALRR